MLADGDALWANHSRTKNARMADFSLLTLLTSVLWIVMADVAQATIPPSVLIQVAHINNTQDFIRQLVRPAGPNITTSQVGQLIEGVVFDITDSETSTINEPGVNTIAAMLAQDDGCSPRNMTVSVPPNADPNVVYWPSCTKLEQCGGCCGHEMLECAPTVEEAMPMKFLKARYPAYGAQHFVIEGWEVVVFQRHLACECRCRVQPHHCNLVKQEYLSDSCRCRCFNEEEALDCEANKRWDEKTCECVCRREYDCYEDEIFNKDTCRCEVKTVTVKPTETTTLVTESPFGELNDPCATLSCRPGYEAERIQDSCNCVIPNGLPDPYSIPTNSRNPTNVRGSTNINTPTRTRSRKRREHASLDDVHGHKYLDPIARRQPMIQGRLGHA